LIAAAITRLRQALSRHPSLVIAVSGGVDSMTLAFVANRWLPSTTSMFHATSPAVPPSATSRVRRYAELHGWNLLVAGTGEFSDTRYRDNPVDRCYFCKSNLYDRIRSMIQGTIASGANTDDLADYRPGLAAAAERAIVHPLVDAGIDKSTVRAIARHYGLHDLAELPAQPCLASRVETGIPIDAGDLAFVDRMENSLVPIVGSRASLRCRITGRGVVIEVSSEHVENSDLREAASRLCAEMKRSLADIRAYERGSAFVGKPSVASAPDHA
jgi:pyridinium-3,5-biscarboxylic acid mononucleotide sulfurtransferase